MTSLQTTYLGLKMRNPLLVTACGPLSDELGKIRRMEDAGAGAVVLYSLFEEQLRLETHELWALTEPGLAVLLAEPTPTYLLLDVTNAEGQWAGRAPALNYEYLRDGRGLDPLAAYGPYQLFAVRCAACP